MEKYCRNCGAELNEGAVVCVKCGHAIPIEVKKDTRSLIDFYRLAIVRYANFRTRASLREYWMFLAANFLFSIIGSIVLILMVAITQSDGLVWLSLLIFIFYPLFIAIPSIAISVRRLHDQDKSGAWWFINWLPVVGWIIFLFFMLSPGSIGENRYGKYE